MKRPEQIGAFGPHFRYAAAIGVHNLRHGFGVQQFIYDAVRFAAFDHVIRNRRGDARQKRFLRGVAFLLYHIQCYTGRVNFYNRFRVNAIHAPETAGTDHFTAVHADFTQFFLHVQQFRKSRDFQNVIHVAGDVFQSHRRVETFAQFH